MTLWPGQSSLNSYKRNPNGNNLLQMKGLIQLIFLHLLLLNRKLLAWGDKKHDWNNRLKLFYHFHRILLPPNINLKLFENAATKIRCFPEPWNFPPSPNPDHKILTLKPTHSQHSNPSLKNLKTQLNPLTGLINS